LFVFNDLTVNTEKEGQIEQLRNQNSQHVNMRSNVPVWNVPHFG